jgi:hypothetical protein
VLTYGKKLKIKNIISNEKNIMAKPIIILEIEVPKETNIQDAIKTIKETEFYNNLKVEYHVLIKEPELKVNVYTHNCY